MGEAHELQVRHLEFPPPRTYPGTPFYIFDKDTRSEYGDCCPLVPGTPASAIECDARVTADDRHATLCACIKEAGGRESLHAPFVLLGCALAVFASCASGPGSALAHRLGRAGIPGGTFRTLECFWPLVHSRLSRRNMHRAHLSAQWLPRRSYPFTPWRNVLNFLELAEGPPQTQPTLQGGCDLEKMKALTSQIKLKLAMEWAGRPCQSFVAPLENSQGVPLLVGHDENTCRPASQSLNDCDAEVRGDNLRRLCACRAY